MLYAAGAARVVGWADSAKLTLYALAGYVPSVNPGDHAGWTVIGRAWLTLVPLPPPASLALLSAFSGAVAVALLFTLVRRSTGEPGQARAAAALLFVAHSFWWSSEVVETYAPAIALSLAAALASTRRGRAASLTSGLAAGLAAACHLFSLALTTPMLLGRRRAGWRLAGFVAGSAPVWLGLLGTPRDPLTGSLSGGAGSWVWHASAFMAPQRMGVGLVIVCGLVALSLGPLGIAALVQATRSSRQTHPHPLAAAAGLVALTAVLATYSPYRLHVMCGFLVVGLLLLYRPLLSARKLLAHLAIQPLLYLGLAYGAQLAGHADLGVRRLPERNNAWYFLEPVKACDDGALRYADALLTAAPERAVVLADFNPGAPLVLVQRLDRLRPDVSIEPTAVDDALNSRDPTAFLAAAISARSASGRPVVLADDWPDYYHPHDLESRFGIRLTPCGPGWRATLTGLSQGPS